MNQVTHLPEVAELNELKSVDDGSGVEELSLCARTLATAASRVSAESLLNCMLN